MPMPNGGDAQMRYLPGADNIMWSPDYPHSETAFRHSMAKIEELFAGVPEDEKNTIFGGRAKALFNL